LKNLAAQSHVSIRTLFMMKFEQFAQARQGLLTTDG
jgi:hypothetical protein